jgi:hypothetical protein
MMVVRYSKALGVSTFVLALAALLGLGPEDKVQGGSTEPLKDEEYSSDTFEFKRTHQGGDWLLEYRFKGLNDNWHNVTCRVKDAARWNLFGSYGYHKSEWLDAQAKSLQNAVNQEAARKGILVHGVALVTPLPSVGRLQLQWKPTYDPLSSVDAAVENREEEQFYNWYNSEKSKLQKKSYEKVMKERGFIEFPPAGWLPDYSSLVAQSTPALKNCVDALNRESKGSPEWLMNFFQSMPWVKLGDEDEDTGKVTGGLRLPPSLMVRAKGDCDSKATAFCVIQREQPGHLLIFRSLASTGDQGHALVGVEAYEQSTLAPGPRPQSRPGKSRILLQRLEGMTYEKPILIGLRYYVPCEVAGPGRRLYGEVAPGHAGDYIAIPIQSLEAPFQGKR